MFSFEDKSNLSVYNCDRTSNILKMKILSLVLVLVIIILNVSCKSLKSSAEIQQNEEEQKMELKEGLARLQNISKQFLGPNSKSKGKLFMKCFQTLTFFDYSIKLR